MSSQIAETQQKFKTNCFPLLKRIHVPEMSPRNDVFPIYLFIFVLQEILSNVSQLSGNLDTPEASLDALMQAAVCSQVRILCTFQNRSCPCASTTIDYGWVVST